MLDRTREDQETLQLEAGRNSRGEPVLEEVAVEPLAGGRFRLLASPGLLDGLAAGDVFELDDAGRYGVVERSGNICVQLYYPRADLHRRVDEELVPDVNAAGGWLDGRAPGLSVLTFPLSVGFPAIERLLETWTEAVPGASWSYANVYAEDGVTPLGWWNNDGFR